MALSITFPTSLPDGRPGLDYGACNLTATADGGTAPYVWEIDAGGTNPTGLVINASTGKLSGIITDDPGDYDVWIKVTDDNDDTVTAKIPMFVSGMPNGMDILLRLPVKDQPGAVMTQLNLVARSALATITTLSGVAFPAAGEVDAPTFGPETLHRNTYSPLAFPDHRPVQSIVSAVDGTQTLIPGTVAELMQGTAGIAIDNRGKAVRLGRCASWDGPSHTIITYTAGFATLPPDLYEVFCELSLLMWKEKDRIGLSELVVEQGTTRYAKELPAFIAGVLETYAAVGQWV